MRKITICLFLVLATLSAFSTFSTASTLPMRSNPESNPDTATYLMIHRLAARGMLLNRGWVYQRGDNLKYAERDYQAQTWNPIDPTVPVPDLPAEMQSGMLWLRLRFKVTPQLSHSASIMLRSAGAVEIYLNGKLVGKRGAIDAPAKDGNNYLDRNTPIELPIKGSGVQVLAIRFAHQKSLAYIGGYTFPPFLFARFANTPQLIRSLKYFGNSDTSVSIAIGILILLTFLHLIFLKYNPEQRANLYFAAYAGIFALFLYGTICSGYAQSMERQVYTIFLNVILYTISVLFGIKALYRLFGIKTHWHLKVLIPLCFLLNIIGAFDEHTDAVPITVLVLILTLVQLALTISAVYHKKRGALIVASGFLVGLIGIFGYFYIIYTFKSTPETTFIIAASLAMLGPALGISFFLGREFALDSQLLQYKLKELEALSAKSIAQEQEKQELLASQNELLEQQVKDRTTQLSQSLLHLQKTQDQLIQSEKMASLGELTAGIAHEIQNPLNFVNNFAEVSQELIDEMQTELKNGDLEEAIAISTDLKQNLEKIHHHGQRANFIVKGMLQHSQGSTAAQQHGNINTLIEEYARLAYNGFRAKDKSFTAQILKDLDLQLPEFNMAAQEIGRVLLNIFTNAFYALREKQKTAPEGFVPEIKITTKTKERYAEIRIGDNATGIPTNLIDKIMQPFFTTKPTGEGTGLGLSLSYDIVVKGHGGQINVESVPGEGSTFVILLPLT